MPAQKGINAQDHEEFMCKVHLVAMPAEPPYRYGQ